MYLATLYFPSLNPIGPPSIFAAGLVMSFAAATSSKSHLSPRYRGILTASAPFVLFFLSAITAGEVWLSRRSIPDADDYTAVVIYYVFGFMFAMNCFRFLLLRYRLIGWVFTIFFGSSTAILAASLLNWLRFMSARRSWREYLEFGAAAIFIVAWVPIALVLDRRARAGLRRQHNHCNVCDYDLRGLPEPRCPECGTPFEPKHSAHSSTHGRSFQTKG